MLLRLEFFYSPYCPRCRQAREHLRSIAADWPAGELSLSELDVLQHLDRAVAAGVLRTPALAINGELVAGPVPARRRLESMLRRRRSRGAPG